MPSSRESFNFLPRCVMCDRQAMWVDKKTMDPLCTRCRNNNDEAIEKKCRNKRL